MTIAVNRRRKNSIPNKKFRSSDVIRCHHRIIGALIDGTDLPVYSIDTRSMKAAAFRHADTTKEEAAAFVSAIYGSPVDHDGADAYGIGVGSYCCNMWKEE